MGDRGIHIRLGRDRVGSRWLLYWFSISSRFIQTKGGDVKSRSHSQKNELDFPRMN